MKRFGKRYGLVWLGAATALSTLLFTGCGNDDSSSANTATISGVVIDGYWKGAKVCIDRNKNAVCDSDEPATTSGDGGQYAITAAQTDTGNYPLAAEGTTETFDEGTGSYLTGNITLLSPAGMQSIVTPITTMVETEIRYNNKSLNDAKTTVANALNITTDDIGVDYVANPNSTLENKATGIANQLQNTNNNYEQVAQDQGVATSAGGNNITDVNNTQVNFRSCQNDSSITTTNNKVYSFHIDSNLTLVNENLAIPCYWRQDSGTKIAYIACSGDKNATFTIDSSLEANQTVSIDYGSSSDVCTIDVIESLGESSGGGSGGTTSSSTYPVANASNVPLYTYIDINLSSAAEASSLSTSDIDISGGKSCKSLDINDTTVRCWAYNGQLSDAFSKNTKYTVSVSKADVSFSFTTGTANVLPRLRTGQTISYVDYDDGWYALQGLGLARSFTRDNTNNIVTDIITGFKWQDDSASATNTHTWSDANTTCTGLNLNGTGWRLPNSSELESISDKSVSDPAIFTSSGFQNIAPSDTSPAYGNYWSSDSSASQKSYAWYMYFYDGYEDTRPSGNNAFYVRCIKSGQSFSPEYVRDNTNQIVTDISSGLMWQDDNYAKTATYNWTSAISTCEDMQLGGYSDWRLPNVNELTQLVDRSKSKPAIDSAFQDTASDDGDYYWSSTTYAKYITNAWSVGFAYGISAGNGKTNSYHVRCVRGGK